MDELPDHALVGVAPEMALVELRPEGRVHAVPPLDVIVHEPDGPAHADPAVGPEAADVLLVDLVAELAGQVVEGTARVEQAERVVGVEPLEGVRDVTPLVGAR